MNEIHIYVKKKDAIGLYSEILAQYKAFFDILLLSKQALSSVLKAGVFYNLWT
jgi:hypothetical protein